MSFGDADTSFQAAGGEAGLRKLVDDFYDTMAANSDYHELLHMHPADLAESRDKLARFLCGWLGGPKRYREKYGAISIPAAHQHLDIAKRHEQQWLNCMTEAIDAQAYSADFKTYLKVQLAVPAAAVLRRANRARER